MSMPETDPLVSATRPLDTAAMTAGSAHSGASLVITGIFYHSAWKYRERAFRYLLLDAGHLGEAVVNAAKAGVRTAGPDSVSDCRKRFSGRI